MLGRELAEAALDELERSVSAPTGRSGSEPTTRPFSSASNPRLETVGAWAMSPRSQGGRPALDVPQRPDAVACERGELDVAAGSKDWAASTRASMAAE